MMVALVGVLEAGAAYVPLDPADPDSMCVHGSVNVLTADEGSSALARGCTGQHVLVEIERYDAPLPPITAFDPPVTRSVRTPPAR